MRVFLVLGLFVGAALSFSACSGSDETLETLCNPGDNIFCKCRGGGEGTKTCKSDGNSFEECINLEGTCEEIPSTTTGSDPSGTSGDPGGTTGGGAGGPGTAGLLEPCATDGDCQSNLCPMGFCTKDCATWEECVEGETAGECVRLNGNTVQWCVSYCHDQTDCEAYGADSLCGFALSLDGEGIEVTNGASGYPVCASWGDELALPPDTTKCPQQFWTGDDDDICHLGFGGAERVCAFGQCTDGCHIDEDCPVDLPTCSAGGSLGSCN